MARGPGRAVQMGVLRKPDFLVPLAMGPVALSVVWPVAMGAFFHERREAFRKLQDLERCRQCHLLIFWCETTKVLGVQLPLSEDEESAIKTSQGQVFTRAGSSYLVPAEPHSVRLILNKVANEGCDSLVSLTVSGQGKYIGQMMTHVRVKSQL